MAVKKKAAPTATKARRGAPKGEFGQPKFVPTADQRTKVMMGAAMGSPKWLIARTLEISEDTIDRHFAEEMALGRPRAIEQASKACFTRALGTGTGAHVLLMFWLKTQAGWKETQVSEFTGPDGKPIQMQNVTAPDLTGLSEEDLLTLERLYAKAMTYAAPRLS